VFITLQPDPDGYGVYTVEQHGAFELVLETEDPIVAVARVEELLAGWPGDVHLATT
jgi:hypothetical protein